MRERAAGRARPPARPTSPRGSTSTRRAAISRRSTAWPACSRSRRSATASSRSSWRRPAGWRCTPPCAARAGARRAARPSRHRLRAGHCRRAAVPPRRERCYGPGVADMKGGVAVALHTARLLAEGPRPFGLLEVVSRARRGVAERRAAVGRSAARHGRRALPRVRAPERRGRVAPQGSALVPHSRDGPRRARRRGARTKAETRRSLSPARRCGSASCTGRASDLTLQITGLEAGEGLNTVPSSGSLTADLRAWTDEDLTWALEQALDVRRPRGRRALVRGSRRPAAARADGPRRDGWPRRRSRSARSSATSSARRRPAESPTARGRPRRASPRSTGSGRSAARTTRRGSTSRRRASRRAAASSPGSSPRSTPGCSTSRPRPRPAASRAPPRRESTTSRQSAAPNATATYSGAPEMRLAARLEQVRDGVDGRHGVDPAREQRERDVDGREEEDEEHRHLHQRAGLERAEARGDARRPARARTMLTSSASVKRPTTSTPLPSTSIPSASATTTSTAAVTRPAGDRRHPVADEDRAAVRRRQHQPPREAVLEVAGDAEAGEHAAERGRLEQHEDELEGRVAGRELEAGQVRQLREAAHERREEEERERDRRDEDVRRRQRVVRRPPRDAERDGAVRVPRRRRSRPRHPHAQARATRATVEMTMSATRDREPERERLRGSSR